MNSLYIPNKKAILMRKYAVRSSKKCHSRVCDNQRLKSLVPNELKYKLYYVCNRCKTNWPQTMLNCPCCGCPLRKKCRHNKGEVKRI